MKYNTIDNQTIPLSIILYGIIFHYEVLLQNKVRYIWTTTNHKKLKASFPVTKIQWNTIQQEMLMDLSNARKHYNVQFAKSNGKCNFFKAENHIVVVVCKENTRSQA